MTSKQKSLYWRTWNQVRIALIERGFATSETAEQNRHELHIKALGYDVSSTALTNEEFDKILGAFRAITQPANLDAQLRQMDMDFRRFVHFCTELLSATGEVNDSGLQSYFEALCHRVGKAAPEALTPPARMAVRKACIIHLRRTRGDKVMRHVTNRLHRTFQHNSDHANHRNQDPLRQQHSLRARRQPQTASQ